MKTSLPFFTLLLFALFACVETPREIVRKDIIDCSKADTIAKGTFVDTDQHQLKGKAQRLHCIDGHDWIRLSEFSVINGPDVAIYLSDSNTFYKNSVELAPFKGADMQPVKGTLVYAVPENVDLDQYNYIIFWCKQYSVRFGYAELKQ